MAWNTGIIFATLFEQTNVSTRSKKCVQKSFICQQDNMAAVTSVICTQNCNGS